MENVRGNKTELVKFRLDMNTREILEEQARLKGMKISSYLRYLINKEDKKEEE